MDSNKEQIISEISTVVASLTLKLETLQAKVDELCKSTGTCSRIKEVNQDLTPPKKVVKANKS
jgi:uncharacterized coiled-coil protein SlyX